MRIQNWILRWMCRCWVLGLPLVLVPTGCRAARLPIERVRLPPGFRIEVFAAEVADARSLALGPQGIVFVGTRRAGKVYALLDSDGDYRADRVVTLAQGLNMPNGVAYRDGALYVAEVSRILKFENVAAHLFQNPRPLVVFDRLPSDRYHGWKYLRSGPDGWLYVPIGAPCNICDRGLPYATLNRLRPDGSQFQVFARGIRNTVGFDWSPIDGHLWLTDNGRDWMGENQPPDELNEAPRSGMHFGYPYCHGKELPDPRFGAGHSCSHYTAPAIELGPHVAALGMRFYQGKMFPPSYRGQIFIAEHGSWNRRTPIGYRITRVKVEGSKAVSYQTFAQGWLQEEKAWGRPVDLLILEDGSMLVSDDYAGAIYRISYAEPGR